MVEVKVLTRSIWYLEHRSTADLSGFDWMLLDRSDYKQASYSKGRDYYTTAINYKINI